MGRDIIVIAGAKVQVTSYAIIVPAYHQGNLGMSFKANQTVDNMAAGFLQLLGPAHVVLLIKAGLDFHQYRHLLAVLGCLAQVLDNGGTGRDAVKGHLDGQHFFIVGGLVDEVDDR